MTPVKVFAQRVKAITGGVPVQSPLDAHMFTPDAIPPAKREILNCPWP